MKTADTYLMVNESNTVPPSMKCSINDEIDEGDLMKTDVYNKLQSINDKGLQMERGMSKTTELSASNVLISPIQNKQISHQVHNKSPLIVNQEGNSLRPNPSPFKRNEQPKQNIKLSEKVLYTESSRNTSVQDFTNPNHKPMRTMPNFAQNAFMLRKMRSSEERDSSNPKDLKQCGSGSKNRNILQMEQLNDMRSTTFGGAQSNMSPTTGTQHHYKQLSQQSQFFISQYGDQDIFQMKKSESTSQNEQDIISVEPFLSFTSRDQQKSHNLFKLPTKLQGKAKPNQQLLHLSSSSKDLRIQSKLSINNSGIQQMGRVSTIANQQAKVVTLSKIESTKQYQSPPMKAKKIETLLNKKTKTTQNKRQVQKIKPIKQVEKTARFSDIADLRPQETPTKFFYNTLQASASERNMKLTPKPRTFYFNFHNTEHEENGPNQPKSMTHSGSKDKDQWSKQKETVNLEDSMNPPQINFQLDDSISHQSSQHNFQPSQAENSRNPNMKQAHSHKLDVKRTREEGFLTQPQLSQTQVTKQGRMNPQHHRQQLQSKRSTTNLGGIGTTKKAHNGAAFSFDNFKQLFDHRKQILKKPDETPSSQFNKISQKKSNMNLNQLQPSNNSSSIAAKAAEAQIKKLQDNLDKVHIKAADRKREIISLKEENLKLRSLVNYLLQTKLNE